MTIEIYAKELSLEIVLKSIEIKEITKTIKKLPCINTSRYNLEKMCEQDQNRLFMYRKTT